MRTWPEFSSSSSILLLLQHSNTWLDSRYNFDKIRKYCGMNLSHSVSDRDVKELFPCPQLSSPLQSWWYSWAAKISELVSRWNLPFFKGRYPSHPLIICRNKALSVQGLTEQSRSAATLAHLQPVGLQVVLHICKDTSYEHSPCDSNFLLRISHACIQREREWLIPGYWL